jgi:diguanylate cyclase (GGDEF)-like protein
VLDLDRLKSLNDVHGHLVGAAAVQTVGQVIGARLPSHAAACRYGGDEFVIALPDHTRAQALEFARQLCADVQSIAPRLAGMRFPSGRLTISVGVAGGIGPASTGRAMVLRDDERGEALFNAADEALYAAKRCGRNGVCEADA